MKLIKNNKEKGFTLIELVVVIAILVILALILIPAISGYTEKADATQVEANARALYTEAALKLADGEEPADIKKVIDEHSNKKITVEYNIADESVTVTSKQYKKTSHTYPSTTSSEEDES